MNCPNCNSPLGNRNIKRREIKRDIFCVRCGKHFDLIRSGFFSFIREHESSVIPTHQGRPFKEAILEQVKGT